MAQFKEREHPRDSDGKFTQKGGASKKAKLNDVANGLKAYYSRELNPNTSMSRKDWRAWYDAIGEIKRGMYVPKKNDKKYIPIGNKIVITTGTYREPIAEKVLEFPSAELADSFIEKIARGKK